MLLAAVASVLTPAATSARVVEIAPSATVRSATVSAINDADVVVGIDAGARSGTNTGPFRWVEGTGYTTLQPFNAFGAGVSDVNAAGTVSGSASNDGNHQRAVLWAPGSTTPTALPCLAGCFGVTQATAINDAGTAVGLEEVAGGDPRCKMHFGGGGRSCTVPVKWSGGMVDQIGTLQGNAIDVSAADAVLVHYADDNGSLGYHVISPSGADTPVSCLSGGARQLNAAGTAVGAQTGPVPALFSGGRCTTLAMPAGDTAGEASAINDRGVMVGTTCTGSSCPAGNQTYGASHAVMWGPDGKLTDLNTLLPTGSGWVLRTAVDVNERGDIVGMATKDGALTRYVLTSAGLGVTLEAFTPAGEKLSGQVASGDVVLVRMTVSNDGDRDLHDLKLAGGTPVVVDPRGTGGLTILSGPTPSFDATLRAHTQASYVYAMTASLAGRAAAETKVSVDDPEQGHLEAAQSLRFDIALKGDEPKPFDQALTSFLTVQAVDASMVASFRGYYDQLEAKAARLSTKLFRRFTPAERKRWFGPGATAGKVGDVDLARAQQNASSPSAMAVQFPKAAVRDSTPEELQAEYNRTLREETGKGVAEWARGWSRLGSAAKKGLKDSWSEAMMSARWALGTATPEERDQMIAMTGTFAEGVGSDTNNAWNIAKREIPRTRANLGYLVEATATSAKQVARFPRAVLDHYADKQEALLPLASSDPMAYQRESAKVAADALNKGLPIIFDTLIGGGVSKVVSAGKAVVISGKGAAVVEAAEALGALDESGRAGKASKTAIALNDATLPHGISATEAATLEEEGAFLKANPNATVVGSSETGKVFKLPNLGGVPDTILDAKATILGDLEKEYAERYGQKLHLAEVLKPGTPLQKVGGVAKVELTSPKTGKPEMVDAGMPEGALGEAASWHNPVSPADANPDFATWAQPRQDAALKAWKKGNAAWKEWIKPEPGSKIARLKACIGKVGRVELDPEPRNGIQRFAQAEFEEVVVKQGTGEARLLRVKKYVVETVDTVRNKVVNARTVVDSPKALPQTPDADSVAIGKVVGRTAAGQPVIAPLSRAEREFIMQRYINKNVQARRLGQVTGLAEHGTTLVMDDASAKAAGFLLPSYGVPFLPDAIGRAYLARIAKFVAPAGVSAEDMIKKMLGIVEAEGGFGQHTVVVTSDSRFFGEVPFEFW